MSTVKGGNTSGPSNVAIDTVAAEDFQRIKLTDGTIGSAAATGVAANPLRTDPTGTTPQPVTAPVGTPVFVRLSDGTTAIATLPVSVAALPLPSGAATAAAQATLLAAVDGLEAALAGTLTVSGAVTVDGSATAANQATLIGHVDGIEALLAGTLTVVGAVTDGGGSLTVDAPVGTPVFVRLSDGTSAIATLPVSVAALPLPSGAATEALQTALNALLPAALGAGGGLKVDGSGTALPVSAAALPLPSGAATSALQGGGLPAALGAGGGVKVDGSGTALPVSGTVTASNATGNVAHDAADSGNPVKVGGKAANALPTAVANADRTDALSDLWGRRLVAHIDPAMQVSKSFNATTTQTGTDVWSPASGKKIAITSIVIGSYAVTAGRLILWFGANADATYSAGTDQLVLAATFTPSASATPGLVFTPQTPIFCVTADNELHITTDAALSVDITVYGYEW